MRAESCLCATAIARGRAGLLDILHAPSPVSPVTPVSILQRANIPLPESTNSTGRALARWSLTAWAQEQSQKACSLQRKKARAVPAADHNNSIAVHYSSCSHLVVSCSRQSRPVQPYNRKISGCRGVSTVTSPPAGPAVTKMIPTLICPADPDRTRSEREGTASTRCSLRTR